MHQPSKRRAQMLYLALAIYVIFLGLLIRDRYLRFVSDIGTDGQAEVALTQPKKESPVTDPKTETTLPTRHQLDVPFTSQAPLAVWDALHEEACEEASLLMVYYYEQNKIFSSPVQVDEQIKALVDWETAAGYGVDVTTAQLAKIAKDYFHMPLGRVIKNPTSAQIKTEIAAGRPVIVPAAGRVLPNPYFTPPGPLYHMLVITGYDEKGFITNDPGTRRGENFRYTDNGLLSSIHDWNDGGDILLGAKNVLVFD